MKKSVVLLLVVGELMGAVPARAEDHGDWAEFGMGVAAIGCNLIYVPGKITYAIIGGVVGSLALGVSAGNMRAANEVWSPTLGGDYVVTSDMLWGERSLHFIGPSYSEPARDF